MVWTPEQRGSAPWPSGTPVLPAQLPPEAIDDATEVASQAAMLALVAQKGDIALRTDTGVAYVLAGADPTVLANWKALSSGTSVTVPADQTADYTAVLGDASASVGMNKATAVNFTVPLNSSVAYPVGTIIEVRQVGAGQVTIVATGGVTLRSAGGALKTRVQYSAASLLKVATDTWSVQGDLTT